VINLATKEEQNQAYWEGFLVGSTPPGWAELFGVEIEDRSRHSWQRSEFDIEEPEDQAYWAGVASGAMVSTSILSGGMYIATAGESMSIISAVSVVTYSLIGAAIEPAISLLRFGARSVPILGLFYLLLQMGEHADTSQRSWTERSHEQRVADAPKVHS